jgi:phosphoribosylglycinamide formyltransferase-1
MTMKIVLMTNAGGRQLNLLLSHDKLRPLISEIISDSIDANANIARKWGVKFKDISAEDNHDFNHMLSKYTSDQGIDAIISFGFTRIFSKDFLQSFRGKVYNSHFSLLPAFPGKRGVDWTTSILPPRAIFERALLYGVRFIGNTIHVVDQSIDGGYPIIQSCLLVPYEKNVNDLRHKLFIQECCCLFQFIIWLNDGRILHTDAGVEIEGAQFIDGMYSPNIEERWISDFALSLGNTNNTMR